MGVFGLGGATGTHLLDMSAKVPAVLEEWWIWMALGKRRLGQHGDPIRVGVLTTS